MDSKNILVCTILVLQPSGEQCWTDFAEVRKQTQMNIFIQRYSGGKC